MRVMPGEKLFDIADLCSVWVMADIYENELPLVNRGRLQGSRSVISRVRR